VTLFQQAKAVVRNRVSSDTWLKMASAWHYATLPRRELEWWRDAAGRESRERLRRMHNRYRGQRCVIMGNGPSLNKTNLPVLASEFTFGMNRIYLAFDKLGFVPSFYVATNDLVLEQCAGEIADIAAPKFLSWELRDTVADIPDSILVRRVPRPHFSTDPTRGVWEGATVTYVTMQIAYYLGFSQVVLIGVDHNFATKGEPHKAVTSTGDDPNHFSPKYFGKGFRWQLPDLERSEVAYAMARQAFEADGREIVDATVGGKLQVFPKVDFDSVFPDRY